MTYEQKDKSETERRIELADRMMTDPVFAGWVEHVEAMLKSNRCRSVGIESAKELLVALLEFTQKRNIKHDDQL